MYMYMYSNHHLSVAFAFVGIHRISDMICKGTPIQDIFKVCKMGDVYMVQLRPITRLFPENTTPIKVFRTNVITDKPTPNPL